MKSPCEHFKDGKCDYFCDDDHGSDVYIDHCHLHNEAICYLKQCPLHEGNPYETEDKCPKCETKLDYCGDTIKNSGYWYCHKCNIYIQDPNGYADLNKVISECGFDYEQADAEFNDEPYEEVDMYSPAWVYQDIGKW